MQMLAAKRHEVSKTEADKGKAVQRNSEEISPSPINPLWHQFATSVPGVQAKLKIGQPGDKDEQEADRVAEQVMRMPEPGIRRKPSCPFANGPRCGEDELKIQAKSANSVGNVQVDHSLIQNVLSSPGEPLDTAARSFMEPRFGQDFSGVRVHVGSQATESARAVNARAYTIGRDMVFGEGEYAPGSDEGKRLVAHELAHVGQGLGRVGPPVLARAPAKIRKFAVSGTEGMVFLTYQHAVWLTVIYDENKGNATMGSGVAPGGMESAFIELPIGSFKSFSKSDAMTDAEQAGLVSFDDSNDSLPQRLFSIAAWTGASMPTPPPPAPRPAIHQPAPVPTPKPAAPQLKSPEQLIDAHETLNFLDEEGLGRELLRHAELGDIAIVHTTLDALDSTDRDDVAYELVLAASDEVLQAMASSPEGRHLLSRLMDELTSGHMGGDEEVQSQRVMMAMASHIDPISFLDAGNKAKVIPFSGLGFTKLSSASLDARLLDNGKIYVKSHMKQEHWQDAKRLPREFVLGLDSIELEPDEVIGVYLYDEGDKIVYVPAVYLLQLGNQEDTKAYTMIGEAVFTGLTLGIGGGGVAGAEGATATGGVWLARGAAALRWADRAATAVSIASTLINDHRGLIIKHFGADGEVFLQHWQTVETIVAIYGLARGAMVLGQSAAALRKSYQKWREMQAARTDLSASERASLDEVAAQTEKALGDIENARITGRGTAVRKAEQEILAERPAAGGHEVEVTPTGVEVCSPRPCPLLRVAYSKELRQNNELAAEMDQIDVLRKTNPEQAAERAAALQRRLEQARASATPASTPGLTTEAQATAEEAAEAMDTQPIDLAVGKKRAAQIASGERDFIIDSRLTFDIDEPLPVGQANLNPSRAWERATDPHNRQLLDSITNRTTKGLGIDPRDIERGKTSLAPVSVTDQPDAIFVRRFDEVTELKEIFDQAAAKFKNRRDLKPTALKNSINSEIRRIIKTDKGGAGEKVRKALETAGFEFVEGRGFVMMKAPAPNP
ncbi:MAG: DUF4157 domain-containing protein [Pigmentiphaga sp.]